MLNDILKNTKNGMFGKEVAQLDLLSKDVEDHDAEFESFIHKLNEKPARQLTAQFQNVVAPSRLDESNDDDDQHPHNQSNDYNERQNPHPFLVDNSRITHITGTFEDMSQDESKFKIPPPKFQLRIKDQSALEYPVVGDEVESIMSSASKKNKRSEREVDPDETSFD